MLIEYLNEESAISNICRLEWVCNHLSEYLERWIGFAMAEGITLESTLQSDLFFCVLAAINILDQELNTIPKTSQIVQTKWSEFRNSVKWIILHPNRQDIDLIRKTFVVFGEVACKKSYSLSELKAAPIKALGINGIE